jgi:uncharacterized protein involved in exopolysaccharide biosynthesis/Mrp family chromosome partitioning ATPase
LSPVNVPPADSAYLDDAVPLRDYWRVLVRHRTFICGLVVLTALATALFTLLQRNIYQSSATLMPLGASRSGLAGALGELGGFLPPGIGGKESPTDRLLAVLQSRTLATDVIEHSDLLHVLFVEQWDAEQRQWRTTPAPTLQDAVRTLGGLVSITASRQGVLTIAVTHHDAVLAAGIANAYVDALQRALNENAFSLAKKNRVFIAAQLEKTRQDLDSAEEVLKQFEQTYKIIALDAQTKAAVEATAAIEGQIRAREVQLGVQQRLLTGASREVYLLQEELQALRVQLARLQNGLPSPRLVPDHQAVAIENQAQFSFEQAPEIKLRYARLQREALVQNKLFTLLAQQLEQARIEEARDETAFQVLDRALPPERKFKPKRSTTVMLATVVSAFVGIMLAFFREYADATIRTREQIERHVGLPLLVTIPAAEPSRRRRQQAAVASAPVLQPSDPAVTEALRYLSTRLKQPHHGQRLQTILLVGIGPDDDTVALLAQLAVVAASTGERTLLIDSNVRQPALHSLLRCPLTPGLAEALATPETWPQVIQHTTYTHLDLVAAGTVTPATYAALDSTALDALLARAKETYDLIVCAAPPVLGLTDAAVLGSKVDATCLVLTCGVSPLDTALEARSVLESVQANLIGAILIGKI